MNIFRIISISALVLVAFASSVLAEPISTGAALLIASIISGGAALGGGAMSVMSSKKGMQLQVAENQRAEREGLKLRKEDIARSERWAKRNFKAQREATKASQKMADKQFGLVERRQTLSEEDRKMNGALKMSMGLWDQFSRKPQMMKNITGLWRGRRAA